MLPWLNKISNNIILFLETKNVFMVLLLVDHNNPDIYIFKNDNKWFAFMYINILLEDTQLLYVVLFNTLTVCWVFSSQLTICV